MKRDARSWTLARITFISVGLMVTLGVASILVRALFAGRGPDGRARGSALPDRAALESMANPTTRAQVAMDLGRRKVRAAAPVLETYAGDSDARVRVACLWALGEIGRPESVVPIAARVFDPDPAIRAAAAEAIGKIPHERSLSALVESLRDRESAVRAAAATGLALQQGEGAVPALNEAARDGDGQVRLAAARALARRADLDSLGPLAARSLDDSREETRQIAAAALRQAAQSAVPAIGQGLSALRTSEGRKLAATLIVELGSVDAIPLLLSAIERAQSFSVDAAQDLLSASIGAIAPLGAAAVPPLAKAALRPGASLPAQDVAAAVYRRAGAAAAEPVCRYLTEHRTRLPEFEAKLWIDVLGDIGGRAALPALRQMADGPQSVRTAAAKAEERINAR